LALLQVFGENCHLQMDIPSDPVPKGLRHQFVTDIAGAQAAGNLEWSDSPQ
jgi:hypothetical protein